MQVVFFSLRKKITNADIIHVFSAEFHEELNGTSPVAEKVGIKNASKKTAKLSQIWAKTRKKNKHIQSFQPIS